MRTVHLSCGSISTSQPPTLTIGSIVKTMPGAEAVARAALAVVRHLRAARGSVRPMPWPTKSRTTLQPFGLDVLLDRGADVAEARAVADLGDPERRARCGAISTTWRASGLGVPT